jgi:uncharacterized protein
MLTLARAALGRPLLVLALLAIGTAAAAKGLFRLELRTDGAAIYPQNDAAVARGAADRKTFLEADQIILLVTARPGGARLASPTGFRYLRALQKTLARFPGVELAGVRSVVTLIDPPETLHPLRIVTFFEEWSGRDEDFAGVLARLRRLPVASGLFLAADGATAAFYLPVGYRSDRIELLHGLRRFLATRPAAGPFLLRLTGPVAAEVDLGEELVSDLSRMVPVMVAAVALLLALSLRTLGGVAIPLAQVVATLVWTLGLMGWCGVPVTLVTTVLPVLLMAMAMTDEIYLLERLQDHLAMRDEAATATAADLSTSAATHPAPQALHAASRERVRTRERVRCAAAAAFGDLATPLVLISLATAAGFFSFLGASIAPLRHLGLFTGVGLLLGMLFTFALAPALMVALPPSWLEGRPVRGGRQEPLRRVEWEGAAGGGDEGAPREWRDVGRLVAYERFTVRRGRRAALVAGALLVAALPGLLRLRVEDSWIDNFDPRSPLVTAARRFDQSFWGLYRFDAVLSGPPRFFWTPRGAAVLEEAQRWSARAPHAGGSVSILPIFEAGARAIGFPLPLSALPAHDMNRVGLLVEVLRLRLYLRDILSANGAHVRARLFVRHADYSKARDLAMAFAAEVPRLAARTSGAAIEIHASGEVPEALAVVAAIVGNQLRSIGWTAVLIAAMLLAALRSLRWTAVVMAPVLAATLLLLAGLGYAGVPLGIATSMFAALNLGAGVDFAVQYVYAYRRERRPGLPHAAALAAALRTTGRGLRCNALVLSCGIAVLAFSAIKPNSSLGLLLALAVLVSYAATLALLPELLRWVIAASEANEARMPSEARAPKEAR